MRLVPYVWARGYLLVDRLRPFGSVGEVLCDAAFFVPVLLALRALTDFTGFSAVFGEVEGVSAFVVAVLRGAAGFVVGSSLDSTAFAVAVLVARVEVLCARACGFCGTLCGSLGARLVSCGLRSACGRLLCRFSIGAAGRCVGLLLCAGGRFTRARRCSLCRRLGLDRRGIFGCFGLWFASGGRLGCRLRLRQAAIRVQAQVKVKIARGGCRPAKVAGHGLGYKLLPFAGLVPEQTRRAEDRIAHFLTIEVRERKTGTFSRVLVVRGYGVAQTAGLADDGQGAIAHGNHLG